MVPRFKFCSVFKALTLSVLLASPIFAVEGEGEGTKTSPVANSSATTTQPTVASVSRERILAISSKIDAMVEAQLSAKGEKLNALSTDEVFLRRAYLDIVGRIPNINETKSFLASKNANKRTELIDKLLDSYGYVSRQYNFWADILRIKSRLPGQLSGFSYIDFVKDNLEQNKPYDEFVRELLTAKGANLEREDGAVGYYLRDRNMPEDNMSNTIRIFLGTRLECAQCHDHPFDKWTQRQYFEMVAFTGGLRYRNPKVSSSLAELRLAVRKGEIDGKFKGIANNVGQALSHGISGSGTGLARLPEGFLGEDGYEGEVITGKTMFDEKKLVDSVVPKTRKKKSPKRKNGAQQGNIFGAKDLDSREAYANWLTDPTNPRFAKVIANRLWKQALGIGLIEPIDIIEDGTVASNPELMDFLTESMIDLNFDTKQYLRAIYNSKTYQAAAYGKDVTDPQKYDFRGPIVRRMTAEQIWDSLMTLTVPNTDERVSDFAAGRISAVAKDPYLAYQKINSMNTEELKSLIEELGSKGYKKKASFKDSPVFKKYAARKAALKKKSQAARKAKNRALVSKIAQQIADLDAEFRKKGPASKAYLRASEMVSPAPAGHFLRQFGQSDRESIENSNTDPAVPQVLAMMNGYVESKIARDTGSMLYKTLAKAKSSREATDLAFLSMLNRKPTSKEAREWKSEFADAAKQNQAKIDEVRHDLIWTLANSNEFIFVK